MGIAEVIPGVSGGTIAFITGIYERLINSIKSVGPDLFKALKKDGIAGAWKSLDGNFLTSLLLGMVMGIGVGVFGVSYLLENYPPAIWAFFFGLIIASVIYIGKQISKWDFKAIIILILCTILAFILTKAIPAQGSESYLYVFICGAIAISALILPGISGSFILLILGMYVFIVQDTLKEALSTFAMDKILIMLVFGMGCLVGLATMSRVLSWTFKHYKDLTLAGLTGFMLGSLNKIWPWRVATEWLRDSNGQIILDDDGISPKKILKEVNVGPEAYTEALQESNFLLLSVISFIFGILIVFLLDRFNK